MKTKVLLITLLAVGSFGLLSTTNNFGPYDNNILKGVVYNIKTKKPVTGVTVSADMGLGKYHADTRTNHLGQFELKLKPGWYNVLVNTDKKLTGYKPNSNTRVEVVVNKTVEVKVYIQPK